MCIISRYLSLVPGPDQDQTEKKVVRTTVGSAITAQAELMASVKREEFRTKSARLTEELDVRRQEVACRKIEAENRTLELQIAKAAQESTQKMLLDLITKLADKDK